MDFGLAYPLENLSQNKTLNNDDIVKKDVTFINPEQDDESHIGCNQKINQLNQSILQCQQELISKQQEINNLSSQLYSKKEYFGKNDTIDKDFRKKYPQVCQINGNKKWIITICIAVVILLFISTYSVSMIDRWLDNNNVDLFSHDDKMNELLLLTIQFIFIVFVVRFILELV